MFLKFLVSRHRSTYIKLAFKHFTTPWHVHSIAHGKKIKGGKDKKIVHDLLRLKIVHRHRQSQNPDNYAM